MLPIKFQFVALGAATQLKGELYKFKPARTKPSPDWTSENGVMNAQDIHAPYTDPSFWTDRYVMATLTMEKPEGGKLVINDAIVNISRRKNIVPIEVKSAKRYTQISLDKFRGKFRPYIDLPTVLDVKDRHAKDGVTYLPLYVAPAFLESI